MPNDLLLVFGIPIAVFSAVLVVYAFESLIVECRHDFGMWETIEPKNESVYIQQRFCKKCNMRQINQIKKEKNGSAL